MNDAKVDAKVFAWWCAFLLLFFIFGGLAGAGIYIALTIVLVAVCRPEPSVADKMSHERSMNALRGWGKALIGLTILWMVGSLIVGIIVLLIR